MLIHAKSIGHHLASCSRAASPCDCMEDGHWLHQPATPEDTAAAVVDALRHLLSVLGAVLASEPGLQAAKDASELRSLPALGKSLKRLWFGTPTEEWDSKEQVRWLCRVLAVTEGSRAGILSFYGAGLLFCDALASFAEISLREIGLMLDEAWAAEALAVQQVLQGPHWQQLQQWPADRRCGGGSDPLLSTDRLPRSLKSAFDLEGVRLTKAQAAGLGVAMLMPGSTVAMGGLGCALLLRRGMPAADGQTWEALQADWLKHAHILLRRKTCPISVRYVPNAFAPKTVKITLYSLSDVLCALPAGSLGTWGGGGAGGEASARLNQGERCRLRPATEEDTFRLRVYRPAPLLNVVLHDGVQVCRGDRLLVTVSEAGEAKVYSETPRRPASDAASDLPEAPVLRGLPAQERRREPDGDTEGESGYVCQAELSAVRKSSGTLAATGDTYRHHIHLRASPGYDIADMSSLDHLNDAETALDDPQPACEVGSQGVQCELLATPWTAEVSCQTWTAPVVDAEAQSCLLSVAAAVQAAPRVCDAACATAEPEEASQAAETLDAEVQAGPAPGNFSVGVQTEVLLHSSAMQTEASQQCSASQTEGIWKEATQPQVASIATQVEASSSCTSETQTPAEVVSAVEFGIQAAAATVSSYAQTASAKMTSVTTQVERPKMGHQGVQVEDPEASAALERLKHLEVIQESLDTQAVLQAQELEVWQQMAKSKAMGRLHVTILCPRAECTVNSTKVEMDSWNSQRLRADFEEQVLPRFTKLIVAEDVGPSSPPELVKGIMEELAAIFRERLMALLTAPDAKSAMAAAAAQAAK
ncbi:unnamed protein product [Effrenium voratum]|uniref:Uncharacterized protein n=1 Tax=Effrenium voratum TaxID=2562239 RepID=A0AA36MKZ5_9DINO|nr:unnamed protein product [Effrenium voratum]